MFRYYNRNPYGDTLPDCVCRAISLATDTPYPKIDFLLKRNGKFNDCDDICVDCYSRLLNEIGYKCYDADGRTVSELMQDYPNKKLLIRLNGHLTTGIYGVCYDIWDCTRKKADIFWIIE